MNLGDAGCQVLLSDIVNGGLVTSTMFFGAHCPKAFGKCHWVQGIIAHCEHWSAATQILSAGSVPGCGGSM